MSSTLSELEQNIFHYATKELSHSALWAWVLSCANSEQDDRQDVRALAEEFLKHVGYSTPLPRVKSVETEVPSKDTKKIRFDILASFEDAPSLLIENKVDALPSMDQLRTYRKHLPNSKCVLLHAGFDCVSRSYRWPKVREAGWKRVGIGEIVGLFEELDRSGIAIKHSLLIDYQAWLKHRARCHAKRACQAKVDDFGQVITALKCPDGQYAFLDDLCKDLHGVMQMGTNLSGTPWTQFAFFWLQEDHPKKNDFPDTLFYRIDRTSKRGFYFAVRQYLDFEKKNDSAKQRKLERREHLRRCWEEAVRQSDKSSLKWGHPRNRGVYESEIGWLILDEVANTPAALRKGLPQLHRAFLAQLEKEGWPIADSESGSFPPLRGENPTKQ